MADNLFVILSMIKAEMPEVSDEAWEKIKRMLSDRVGGERAYVPLQPKRSKLEMLADVDAAASNAVLAQKLGVSVSRIKQLKRLRGR